MSKVLMLLPAQDYDPPGGGALGYFAPPGHKVIFATPDGEAVCR